MKSFSNYFYKVYSKRVQNKRIEIFNFVISTIFLKDNAPSNNIKNGCLDNSKIQLT